MERKLGTTYKKFASVRDGHKILLRKLKETLRDEVGNMLKQNDMLFPPFDPFKVSKIGNAEIEMVYADRAEIGSDGSIETCDNGFLVKIDKTLAERPSGKYRLRSTMAHELMHTFFYDVSRFPPIKMGYRVQSRKQLMMEEELCYYLAREFLIPSFFIFDLLKKEKSLHAPTVANMKYLQSTFVVSSDIIAYRIISDLSMWNAMFIKFVQTGSVFKSKTKLKNKSNRLFKKIKIPALVPLKSSISWVKLLSDHILRTANVGRLEEIISLDKQLVALESLVETRNPLSIISVIYQVD